VKLKTKINWIALVALTLCSALGSIGFGADKMGNGGDTYADEFKATARKILSQMKAADEFGFIIKLSELEAAIESTKVITVDKACLMRLKKNQVCPTDMSRDAVNFPEDHLIHLTESRWAQRRVVPELRDELVLHEFYGIIDFELNDNYKNSHLALKRIKPDEQKLYSVGYYADPNSLSSSSLSFGDKCLNRCDGVEIEELNYCRSLKYETQRAECNIDIRWRSKDCYLRCDRKTNWIPKSSTPKLAEGMFALSKECQAVENATFTGIKFGETYALDSSAAKLIANVMYRGDCNGGRPGFYDYYTGFDEDFELSVTGDTTPLRYDANSSAPVFYYPDGHFFTHHNKYTPKKKFPGSDSVDAVEKSFVRVLSNTQVAYYAKLVQYNMKSNKPNGLTKYIRMKVTIDPVTRDIVWIERGTLTHRKNSVLFFSETDPAYFEIFSRLKKDSKWQMKDLNNQYKSLAKEFESDVKARLD